MPALKIGVQLTPLRLPFKQALARAADLGANAVEIDARGELSPSGLSQTGLRQLRKMLDDLRLGVSAVAFRTRLGYDTMAELEPRIAATKAAMQFAYNLGASVVVNHVGPVPAERESESWRLMVEVLGDLGHHGHRVGALLAADTGTESGEDLGRLLAELPEGAVGVNFNPGALVGGGFSPLEAIDALGRWIVHVHASDAAHERTAIRGRPISLGQGVADFPALLAALDQYAYRGYFTVACPPSDDPSAEIDRAIRYLRQF